MARTSCDHARQFLGAGLHAAQVEFAGTELGKGFDWIQVFALGHPEARHAGFAELTAQFGRCEGRGGRRGPPGVRRAGRRGRR